MAYQVLFTDEFKRTEHLGFYNNLEESLPKINEVLKFYEDVMLDHDCNPIKFKPLDKELFAYKFKSEDNQFIFTDYGSLMISWFLFDLREELRQLERRTVVGGNCSSKP